MVGVGALALGSQVGPLRSQILKRIDRGAGPSESRRARSSFDVTFVAMAGGRRVVTRVSGGDPGYTETSMMLAESGLCLAFDDLPALAAKLKARKVGLWSPVDIQQIMPTGDRALIEAEAERMVRLFDGFLIMKNYGDLAGIGVQEEWDMWAYNAILRAAGLPVQD